MDDDYTCHIVEDQTHKGYFYMDHILLKGNLKEWPAGTPASSNNHLRVVLMDKNWERVKSILYLIQPYDNAVIPRDLYQFIDEANLPENFTMGADVISWKKQRATLQRGRQKQPPPKNRPKPSPSETSEAAEKLIAEATNVRLPEPPHIPESAFVANNPNSTTFKFPKVNNPAKESAYARAAFVAQAEVAAHATGQTLASDTDESEEEDDGNSGASSVSLTTEEEEEESAYEEDDQEQEKASPKKVHLLRGRRKHPRKQPDDKEDEVNPWEDDQEQKKAAKTNTSASPTKVTVLQGRKKHPFQKQAYGGKRGSRSITKKQAPSAAKKNARKSDSDDDYDEEDTNDDDFVAEDKTATKLKLQEIVTHGSSQTSGGVTFTRHVFPNKPSSAERFNKRKKGKSGCRQAGSRPKTIRQQLDRRARNAMKTMGNGLITAQRMASPLVRSDSFDPDNKDPAYLADRESEREFPTISHMVATYTEQLSNGDGQNKRGQVALSKPQLHICVHSEVDQKALEAAFSSGNLEIHTYNHFPRFLDVFGSGVTRGKTVQEDTDDDEDAAK